jgi:hypothetical protein
MENLSRDHLDALPRRHPLESGHPLGDLMERLLVDSKDRHLRRTEDARIIERSGLQDHSRQIGSQRRQVRPAFSAELSRHGLFQIAARKSLRLSFGIAKPAGRHDQKHVRCAAAYVLALATMALPLHHGPAFRHVANSAAVATAFELLGILLITCMHLPVLLLDVVKSEIVPDTFFDDFRAMVEAKTQRFAGIKPAHRPPHPNSNDCK